MSLWRAFLTCLGVNANEIHYCTYCVYSVKKKIKKQPNMTEMKRAKASVFLIVFKDVLYHVRVYTLTVQSTLVP